MALVREWLLGVTAAAILAALAGSLMPPGAVRQVGKLACGLLLVWAMLRPLLSAGGTEGISLPDLSGLEQEEQLLRQQTAQSLKAVIESRCAAYIADKAAQLGTLCQVEVECRAGEDGVFLPDQARLYGSFSDAQQSRLTEWIQTDLGIPPERQSYFIVEEESP